MSDALTNEALIAAFKTMLTGLSNSLPAGLNQLSAGGKVSPISDIQTEITGYLGIYQAVEDAHLALAVAIQARDEIAPTAIPRYEEIRLSLKGAFGRKSPQLTKVGIQPDKTPPPPTVEQKQERVAKTLATRAARGTKGKKQKAAIHGTVPATPATPTPTPATPKPGP